MRIQPNCTPVDDQLRPGSRGQCSGRPAGDLPAPHEGGEGAAGRPERAAHPDVHPPGRPRPVPGRWAPEQEREFRKHQPSLFWGSGPSALGLPGWVPNEFLVGPLGTPSLETVRVPPPYQPLVTMDSCLGPWYWLAFKVTGFHMEGGVGVCSLHSPLPRVESVSFEIAFAHQFPIVSPENLHFSAAKMLFQSLSMHWWLYSSYCCRNHKVDSPNGVL